MNPHSSDWACLQGLAVNVADQMIAPGLYLGRPDLDDPNPS
jgi:hypothetical protein